MTEADILATTYNHVATVKRSKPVKVRGFDDYELQTVYENLLCAVSFTAGSTDGESDTVQAVSYLATLFARPEVRIQPGDVITADVEGVEYEFLAGEGPLYPSHVEVPLIRRDRA